MLRTNLAWTDRQPATPATRLLTIGEAAAELGLEAHVLRFWERKFNQIAPVKRGGGRRYYGPEDIELLRRIQSLLYNDGFTIKGVQRLLDDESSRAVTRLDLRRQPETHLQVETRDADAARRQDIEDTLGDLRQALALLREALQ
ncbi:MerR family transcriptional regulator [Vineibacter terrae]|uniref:MerR family transcriptional regulator n=1 Tax=Vineibacter terrae TaxID=2586908 RepID=A0A5C8PTL9_9HYPH|nr:MerR family transcriptional regulator [Vineibacter terrae]